MDWIIQHSDELLSIAFSLYTVAATIVALTPTTADDDILDRVANVLRTIGILPPKAGK